MEKTYGPMIVREERPDSDDNSAMRKQTCFGESLNTRAST